MKYQVTMNIEVTTEVELPDDTEFPEDIAFETVIDAMYDGLRKVTISRDLDVRYSGVESV